MSASARRLFHPSLPEQGGKVDLEEDAAHHARVLRVERDDPVCLFDGSGRQSDGRIAYVDADRVVCEVHPPHEVSVHRPRVVLVQAMGKGAKVDDIVRMATELGVTAIQLAITERTVARPDARRAATRLQRLQRIAREAARQSGRSDVPEITSPAPLSEVTSRAPSDARRLVFWEQGEQGLDECGLAGSAETWVCVGPEGGLAAEELRPLRHQGWVTVALGTPVLRVETAAPVAVALVLDRLGGLRPTAADRDLR